MAKYCKEEREEKGKDYESEEEMHSKKHLGGHGENSKGKGGKKKSSHKKEAIRNVLNKFKK